MKLFVIFLFTFVTLIFPQNITYQDLNSRVRGIVYQGNQQYLITDKGYIKVYSEQKSVNDQWAEYYRKAFGDSTIQNPNTIIEQPTIPIRFFMPIGTGQWYDREVEFENEAYLYDFIEAGENGNFIFRPGIIGIIGKMQKVPRKR